MTTGGAILWGLNNEKSKNFKTDTLTIRLKKRNSEAPRWRNCLRHGSKAISFSKGTGRKS